MWITTVTYDLAAIRAMDTAQRDIMLASVTQKKDELKLVDGAGLAMAEYQQPANLLEIPSSDSVTIIKRVWNQKTNAQSFIDHVATFNCATITLEEQI